MPWADPRSVAEPRLLLDLQNIVPVFSYEALSNTYFQWVETLSVSKPPFSDVFALHSRIPKRWLLCANHSVYFGSKKDQSHLLPSIFSYIPIDGSIEAKICAHELGTYILTSLGASPFEIRRRPA